VALSGATLHVDVVAQGRQYGVAYVTARELETVGAKLPERQAGMGDALQVVRGVGPDRDAVILILRDSDYRYDDHVGDSHERTAVTAELSLRRDVSDFLVRARAERWK
jgi:hypothetical protein